MNWSHNSMKLIGLNDTEVAILSALQSIKSINDIVKETKISRTGVVYSLGLLVEKGLAEKVTRKKPYHYMALDPARLSETLRRMADEISVESGTVQGARVRTSTESEFIVHVGAKEIISMYERVMSLNKGERWKAIQPNKSWMNMHKNLTSEELIRLNQTISKSGIIVDAILQDNAYRLYREFFKKDKKALRDVAKSFTNRAADYVFVPSRFFNYNAEIWLLRNTFCIINWQDEVAIEITNHDIMHFFHDMFELVKEQGTKVDHNRAMAEIAGEE